MFNEISKVTGERFVEAREIYSKLGIDAEAAVSKLSEISLSIHCWQGDDIAGFEGETALSGGIAVTGNYKGKARNPQELMADIDKVLSLIGGKHRINLHAIYAITDEKVGRNKIEPKHFSKWVEFAKERGLGLDFNPTLFSHELASDGLTLSHPDEKVRRFWIEHCMACREIAAYFGKELKTPSLCNIWIPDGYKDIPADRLSPRLRLKAALDEIYSVKYDEKYLIDCVESKVFGIGAESYTVGSHEFYMGYALKNSILCLLDNGHFHPTEKVSDKISSILAFSPKLALHVTRPVRWDSDHVVLLDDELKEIAKELVACDALDKTLIGLDYFDAGINRIAAWTVGIRSMQKALLLALLTPHKMLSDIQNGGNPTDLFVLQEELKAYPFTDVWDYFCEKSNIPLREAWYQEVKTYEKEVLSKR